VSRSDQSSSTRTRLLTSRMLGSGASMMIGAPLSTCATERPTRRPTPASETRIPAKMRTRRPREANQELSMMELLLGSLSNVERETTSADQGDRPYDELARQARAAASAVGFQTKTRLDGNMFAGRRAVEVDFQDGHADKL